MIHADAAWGGYFATLMVENEFKPIFGHHGSQNRDPSMPYEQEPDPSLPDERKSDPPCALRHSTYTNNELHALRHVDSVTVDPHKSGYIPYPAGAICYRDGRLRYLVTWKSPVLNIGEKDTAVGIYGISGRFVYLTTLGYIALLIQAPFFSKPGAAALAVYLSHAVIGLKMSGYGSLLGTALFTGTKVIHSLV